MQATGPGGDVESASWCDSRHDGGHPPTDRSTPGGWHRTHHTGAGPGTGPHPPRRHPRRPTRAGESQRRRPRRVLRPHDAQITSAAAARDAALADLARTHDAAADHAKQGQQNCVHQLHHRGLKVDDIATLTGWSTTEIRKALRARPTPTTNTTNDDAGDDTGDGDLVEATGTDTAAEGSVA